MEVRLDPEIKNKDILSELLESRGIVINPDSSIRFLCRGTEPAKDGISIVFDPSDLDGLISFIDSFREASSGKEKQHVIGKRSDGFSMVPVASVLYFESMGNDVYCRTVRERLEVNAKLYELEKDFSSFHMVRISKSYIVNIRWIDEIFPWFGSRLLLKCKETGEKLEVSRNYVKSFKTKIGM